MKKIKAGELSQADINRILSDAWLNINIDSDKLYNPLLRIPQCCEENPHHYVTWLMSQPEYFSFVCSQILNVQIYPLQSVILKELWHHKFPMLIGARGLSKSFTLALYSLLQMLLIPGRKIVLAGAAWRQSKIVFEYMENIWNNAPLLRDLSRGTKDSGPTHGTDIWTFRIGDSTTRAIPLGHAGEKVRGLRANSLLVDEFSSIQREIFETVLSGFLSVSSNPIEMMKLEASKKIAKILNIEFEFVSDDERISNQLVISGTAFYEFNHFFEYWKRWRDIIISKGTNVKASSDKDDEKINWKQFCIMRIPVDLVPKGFMDAGQIARMRASMNDDIFKQEFGAVFSKDSAGFFKRSLIESAVASPQNNINIPNYGTVVYGAKIIGDPKLKYIIAVDPASVSDNFAIIIIELHDNHSRIVYCWTTNQKDHRERLKAQLVKESVFYAFCARKIRELMKVFPCELIAIDSQGGGLHVLECLHDVDKLLPSEIPLWPIIDPDNPADTDREFGKHILKLVNFADANWTATANHGLKKDLGDKTLLFPYNDAVDLAIEIAKNDKDIGYDTLEDCIYEIEELKNELSNIVQTETPHSGRERWDTPEIKLPGAKKGRMRKDRYSALVIASMEAHTVHRTPILPEYHSELGWADRITSENDKGALFVGPDWVNKAFEGLYD